VNVFNLLKIFRRTNDLAIELALPDWLKIHPVASIEHLQLKVYESYQRPRPVSLQVGTGEE
jgi:hypothetical protein